MNYTTAQYVCLGRDIMMTSRRSRDCHQRRPPCTSAYIAWLTIRYGKITNVHSLTLFTYHHQRSSQWTYIQVVPDRTMMYIYIIPD